MKFVPVTVNVKAEPPAVAELGDKVLNTGAGVFGGGGAAIKKRSPFDKPPPGVGLNTFTVAVPEERISDARIDAVNVVLLTKVVARSRPFHLTTDPAIKLFPRTE